MYCPVYDCNSDSQKTLDKKINFFSFPRGKTPEQHSRQELGLKFGSAKRSSYKHVQGHKDMLIHFVEDAYDRAYSRLSFLRFLDVKENSRCI